VTGEDASSISASSRIQGRVTSPGVSRSPPGNAWIVAREAGGDDENFFGPYVFSNDGNTLTIVSVDDWWFDFDSDGVPDPAQLRIVLTKT
jgi:hypothetical protein